ncbi:hypothetical protein [Gordonia sp. SL306]|uniref:hypothetical protein n=1 Tax=Gordonia sp. SL306 TaxID=2995145 RepID=UPI00226F915F|nr:hypothetical protein [Gordonia sp. SL306]WAC55016.1 hypothetical protein OVA31_20640 [Gordonia sp. SL306]
MSEESGTDGVEDEVEVSALAINVTIPEPMRWTDRRRDEEFTLTTLNVRLLPDGRLAAKAYGRPTHGGRGTYTSFRVPDDPEISTLIDRAAARRDLVVGPSRTRVTCPRSHGGQCACADLCRARWAHRRWWRPRIRWCPRQDSNLILGTSAVGSPPASTPENTR